MNNIIKNQKIFRVAHLPGSEPPEPEKFGILQSLEEYDKNGNLIMESAYTPDGELADRNEYRYDSAGRVIESLIYGEDGDVLERTDMERDEAGRLEKELVYYLDGSVDTRTFYYDENGHLTGMEVIDDEEEMEYSEKYFYDEGRLVRIERYEEDNEVIFFQEDTYDNGVISKRRVWSSEEEEPFSIVTEYNRHGRREKETRYDSRDKVTERNTWEEDDLGRVVRVTEENRQRKNTTEIAFDDKGHIVYQKEVNVHGDINHEVFRTYDEEGKTLRVTVEAVQRNTGDKRAYTLFYIYESFEE